MSLLVFDGPNLPGPLPLVSPWLDLTAQPAEKVVAALDAQDHRRFIKTHTPLDGLVLDDRVTYIGVGRDPRDAAVSMLMDQDRMRALHQVAGPPRQRFAPPGLDFEGEFSPLDVLRRWMDGPIVPTEGIASLATILHHFGSVWSLRHLPNVAAFHYADYQVDLVGQLVRLAQVLRIDLGRGRAEELAEHATLDAMRARDSELAPKAADGVWQKNEPFFRAGGRGEWREISPGPSTGATPTARPGWPGRTCSPGRTRAAGDVIPTMGECDHAPVTGRVVYRSWMSDNQRWDALKLREGDIVISAPSKCGVTWTQRLVSLLVFDGPDLPAALSTVSPWLDLNIRPIEQVVAALDAQDHRRFIKTHTPLDGLVLDDRVTYIGVGRDPRDAAVSELRQWDNMNLDRMRALQDALLGPRPDGMVRPLRGPTATPARSRRSRTGWRARSCLPRGWACPPRAWGPGLRRGSGSCRPT